MFKVVIHVLNAKLSLLIQTNSRTSSSELEDPPSTQVNETNLIIDVPDSLELNEVYIVCGKIPMAG